MSQFQKIKVSVDQSGFETAKATFEGKIEFYQNVIDQIKNIIPAFIFSENDLTDIFSNPKAFLVDKIIKEPAIVGGMELSKEKVFEILKDSDQLQSIVNYVEKLKLNLNFTHGGLVTTPAGQFSESHRISHNEKNLHVYARNYIINANGEVFIKQSEIDLLEDQYSVFLTTEKEKSAFDSLVIIQDELNKLSDTYQKSHLKFIEDYFIVNGNSEILGINFKALSRLR